MSNDFQPFREHNPDGNPRLILIGDHASNALPHDYGTLGLPEGEFARHIAYDIGTAGIIATLSDILDIPAVTAGFSRLLIDPNRGEDDPTLVMKLSDGAIIPGNRRADAAEIERRLAAFYRPYHNAVDAAVARATHRAGQPPAIVSIHSFTPQLRGRPPRPWHLGVLWTTDQDSAEGLISQWQAEPELCVGENEPYIGGVVGDSLHQHAVLPGLRHALVEIRNDLIASAADQAAWATRIAPAIRSVFGV